MVHPVHNIRVNLGLLRKETIVDQKSVWPVLFSRIITADFEINLYFIYDDLLGGYATGVYEEGDVMDLNTNK